MTTTNEETISQPMSPESPEEAHHQVMEPQLICDGCGRLITAGTEWHSITSTDPDACANGDGGGYWVCRDCHQIIHEWMEKNPETGQPAKEGFHRIYKGVRSIIEDPPRKYRRTTTGQGEDDHGSGETS